MDSPIFEVSGEPSHAHASAHIPAHSDSLFERCSWFYALCREYLFRDHTPEISRSLFGPDPAKNSLPSIPPSQDTHLLELGCGPGFYACRLAQEFPQIRTTGIDLSQSLIARARSRAASRRLRNCDFQHADAQALPTPSASVNAIVVSRLFLIVPQKADVLSEIYRVLRPGGRCFIAEPTSGFRTRIPLAVMWLLARLTTSPAGKYREPRQADVMSRPDFAALIRSQPWAHVDLQYDGWYQYAVCQKSSAADPATASASSDESSVTDHIPAHALSSNGHYTQPEAQANGHLNSHPNSHPNTQQDGHHPPAQTQLVANGQLTMEPVSSDPAHHLKHHSQNNGEAAVPPAAVGLAR